MRALTGLRFFAALGVVLFHLSSHGRSAPFVGWGFLGVSFFFVLSGFILTYTYFDPSVGTLRGTAREFWWARFARIYPVYVLALVTALPELLRLLQRSRGSDLNAFRGALVSLPLAPLLLQSWWPPSACRWNCPAWSLSAEALFYALFPVLLVWLARRRRVMLDAVGVWLVGLIFAIVFLAVHRQTDASEIFWLNALTYHPLARLPEFIVGVVSGLLFVGRRESHQLAMQTAGRAAPVGAVALIALLVTVDPNTSRALNVLLHAGTLAPVWGAIILTMAASTGGVAEWLGSRWVVRLGEASYALYLTHEITYAYLTAGLRDAARFTPAFRTISGSSFALLDVIVSILVSLAILTWIEEPARKAIRARVSRSHTSDTRSALTSVSAGA